MSSFYTLFRNNVFCKFFVFHAAIFMLEHQVSSPCEATLFGVSIALVVAVVVVVINNAQQVKMLISNIPDNSLYSDFV